MYVWAVYHRAYIGMGDVTVSSSRSDDPEEWEHAELRAARNARICAHEAERWIRIANELRSEADATRTKARLRGNA